MTDTPSGPIGSEGVFTFESRKTRHSAERRCLRQMYRWFSGRDVFNR